MRWLIFMPFVPDTVSSLRVTSLPPKPRKEKRRFRGEANRPLPSHANSASGPVGSFRKEDLREALRARKALGRAGHKRTACGWSSFDPASPARSPPCRRWSGSRVASGVCHSLPAPPGSAPRSAGVTSTLLVRGWAALPGFPPTQGLPGLFLTKGTDRSEAAAPREEKGTTRPFP